MHNKYPTLSRIKKKNTLFKNIKDGKFKIAIKNSSYA